MTSIFAFPVHLPVRWPIDTKDPIRAAQIRVLLNTVVTDALAAWRAAPERTWADIGALVYRQLRTLDVLYPEAGILDTPARAVAVQFFATNVHSSIRNLRYRDGDMPNPALARLCRALRSCPKTANGQRSENANAPGHVIQALGATPRAADLPRRLPSPSASPLSAAQ
jgi:hypothetical protein